jgi:hypothetical protein
MSATKTSKHNRSLVTKPARSRAKKPITPVPEMATLGPAKTAQPKSQKPTDNKPHKLSALDAAAKVLAEASEPLTTRQMIDAMAAQGYWTSPGGATPAATLYSAIIREIAVKGKNSRFTKAGPGKFVLKI